MHKIGIAALAAFLVFCGQLISQRAEALPLQGAPAIGIAGKENNLRQDVAYVCWRAWRCGRYGCGWRRVCGWRPGPYAYPRAYRYSSPYYFRPYWRGYRRPYWRSHRYWARPHWRGRRYWR